MPRGVQCTSGRSARGITLLLVNGGQARSISMRVSARAGKCTALGIRGRLHRKIATRYGGVGPKAPTRGLYLATQAH